MHHDAVVMFAQRQTQKASITETIKNGSLFVALSSGLAICPSGVMVLYEVARRLMTVFGG